MSTSLRLSLVRHAKSSWKHPGLADHDRPLNARGRRDAPRMGARLAGRGFAPELVLTSTAVRARATAEAIAAACGIDGRVRTRRALYHASPEAVLEVVEAACERAPSPPTHVAVVGHNPGLTDLVTWLSGAELDDLPTCGVATLLLDAERVADLISDGARLESLETPKNDPERDAASAPGEPRS